MAETTMPMQQRLSIYLQLAKIRLLSLVLISTAMGYYLAARIDFDPLILFYTLAGVLLVGGGANTLNQWYERNCDVLMERTRTRPLPSQQITPNQALLFGLVISVAGFFILWLGVNNLTLLLSFLSWSTYLLLYTPLKRVTVINTWIGAVPGALPAVLGCTAATGVLDQDAITLFMILYIWQMPHFFAISWVYREDYKKGGFKMLSGEDPDGIATSSQILTHTFLLLFASIGLFFLSGSSLIYLVLAILAGLASLGVAINFYMDRSVAKARAVFRVSILYLPVLFLALILDRLLLP